MKPSRDMDLKETCLSGRGVLNSRAGKVKDLIFQGSEFFDPRDLLQVKYEMVRRVEKDGYSVSRAAKDFGFSRPSFYEARAALMGEGLAGLFPGKRGPRGGRKLTVEVLTFARAERAVADRPTTSELLRKIEQRFGIRAHRRSLERALGRDEKKT